MPLCLILCEEKIYFSLDQHRLDLGLTQLCNGVQEYFYCGQNQPECTADHPVSFNTMVLKMLIQGILIMYGKLGPENAA